jgi:short-subunit dehydrogenase
MEIHGALAIVTGASSGIGAATAEALAQRGARVVLLARRAAELEQIADGIRARGGEAHSYPVDLADGAAVEQIAQAIRQSLGVPDIIINNAGAGRWLFIEETDPAEAVEMMAAPYFAAFNVTRAFMPAMLQRGSGRIAVVTSPACYFAWPGATGYTAARWAMRGFAAGLRADLHGTGVRVTLVTPALVNSPYFARNAGTAERIPRIARIYRTLTPQEVAAAIVRGVERGSREVVIPWLLRLVVQVYRVLPGPIDWLLVKTGWRRRPRAAVVS